MRTVFAAIACLLLAVAPVSADTRWTLVASHPHDPTAFTEGLLIDDGLLYESTGLVGKSEIRVQRLSDGHILRRVAVPPPTFGEGIVLWRGRIASLSWRGGRGFFWSADTLRRIGDFRYRGEGWGLTHDGARIVMSDGSDRLRFLDPGTMAETGRIAVRDSTGRPVPLLNELEYMDGEILANVWTTERIARIDPKSGRVIDWIDLSALTAQARAAGADGPDDVLNGIAWDARARRLYVTGKHWPKLYEIRLER